MHAFFSNSSLFKDDNEREWLWRIMLIPLILLKLTPVKINAKNHICNDCEMEGGIFPIRAASLSEPKPLWRDGLRQEIAALSLAATFNSKIKAEASQKYGKGPVISEGAYIGALLHSYTRSQCAGWSHHWAGALITQDITSQSLFGSPQSEPRITQQGYDNRELL